FRTASPALPPTGWRISRFPIAMPLPQPQEISGPRSTCRPLILKTSAAFPSWPIRKAQHSPSSKPPRVEPPARNLPATALKKWADANRRFNGDRWLALEAVYGEGNVYQFTSTRKDYADIDKTNEAVMAAVNKAFGKEASQKMEQDFNNCLVWSRSELRRRRWDLSRKAPQGSEAYAKFIGESRLLRTTAVHIRPGRVPDFEALSKEMKE